MNFDRADATTLMRQAPMTAQVYLMEAVKSIDAEFGDGYAKEHPDLVGVFMQVCVQDFGVGLTANTILDAVEYILSELSTED